MIGLAVFDLDGTLVDSVPMFARILNAMLAETGAGPHLSEAEVRPHATVGGLAMVTALLGDRCGAPEVALGDFRRRYAEIPTPPESLYPGAREALTALRESGIALALFSNKPQSLCEKVLGDLGLASLFSAIVGSGPSVPLKPDRTGLHLAATRAGASLGDTAICYVGDSEPDFALALAAGAPLVMVSWGYGEAGRDWPGACIAHRFADVPKLVSNALAAYARAA